MKSVIAIRLPADIDERLTALVKRNGHTKAYYAREALVRLIDDIEDTYLAVERLENPGKRLTMAQAEKDLGLDG